METLYLIKNLEAKTIAATIFCILLTLGGLTYAIINKELSSKLRVITAILSLGSLLMVYSILDLEIRIKKIKQDFSLTNGKIYEYIYGDRKGHPGYAKYGYVVNNIYFTNSSNEDNPQYYLNKETEYLVIYEKNNPKNSFILFDYPVSNHNDLKKYGKIFEKGIPKDVFE